MKNYKDQLFENYQSSHVAFLDDADADKITWFLAYAKNNYLSHLPDINANPSILEIGSNKGYLLKVLWDMGFHDLYGIDLSPDDVEYSRKIVPNVTTECKDAFEFLSENKAKFDVIILKAVLEHLDKNKVFPLLELIQKSLKPGGRVIIDVPNMDWLFAQHERYMDFTHEIGFTRESLGQIMRIYFENVNVYPEINISFYGIRGSFKKQLRKISIRLINIILMCIGDEGCYTWWMNRCIIGVGFNGKKS